MVGSLIYFLYRVLLTAVSPLLLLYLLARGVRRPSYFLTLPERLGFLPRSLRQTGSNAIWLHAVSVGEVLSIRELLGRLRTEFPGAPLYVSTGTLAGRQAAGQRLDSLADGVFYAPFDFPWIVRRVLRRIRPVVVVVVETEIWPNLYREVKRAGCGLVIVNGRISERTAWRYRLASGFFRQVLRWPDAILTQSEDIAGYYVAAGAPATNVRAAGNLKYNVQPGEPPAAVLDLLDRVRPDQVWIAASTMPPDEDEIVIEAFWQLARQHPRLLLILAPRRPERFDLVATRLHQAGVSFLRRSALAGRDTLALPGVLLLDSVGELSGLFGRADVVFMGGSLVPRGGHNILEPAIFGKPVVVGPHMENFREIADTFRDADALGEIIAPEELPVAIHALLADPRWAAQMGARARRSAEVRRGAAPAALEAIRAAHATAVPVFQPSWPVRTLIAPMRLVWFLAGLALDLWHRLNAGELRAPVISVGNIAMGGTGKTPLVLHLAGNIWNPGILTRGHGRTSRERSLLFAPGETALREVTGDEAQMFLRAGQAAVGIGADRLRTGRLLEDRFDVEAIILDDGFQHRRLKRQIDLVLIDALDPFPPVRRREPWRALRRAGILVITRSPVPRPGIEERLRRYNPTAPIFYAHTVPEGWVDAETGEQLPLDGLPAGRVVAFCGLAQPAAFWQTLGSVGVRPVARLRFRDHHIYRPGDLDRIRAQGDLAVTTEKDAINLPARLPGPIYWLKVRVRIDREEEFERVLTE